MIFLQGLEKVQVTIQTQLLTVAGSTVTKWKCTKQLTESQLFIIRLHRLSIATKYADWA